MSYLNELKKWKSHRQKNNDPRNCGNQQKVDEKMSLRQVLLPYCKAYCDISSIHCIHYVTEKKREFFEKVIWFVLIAATTICTVLVYMELADLYQTQRIQTTVEDTVHPIFFIPFPSVAVCPRNRVNWLKLQTAHTQFLPRNVDNQTVDAFRRFFERLDDFRFGKFSYLHPLFKRQHTNESEPDLTLIADVNILDVMKHLSFNCVESFFGICYWRKKTYNCCELFTLERTEYGFCHVFNSVVSQEAQKKALTEKYYPYHNSKAGEGSGLEMTINLDETKMRPGLTTTNGVHVIIKQPEQWHSDARFINYNTYTKIPITAQLTETDKRTRVIAPDERKCLFEDEHSHPLYKKIPGLLYWKGNCITHCHQEYILKYCHCNLNLLFPNAADDNVTNCKPAHFKCLYEHDEIFTTEHHESESEFVDDVGNNGMICNCLNSCNQLIFGNIFNSVPLDGINASASVKQVHLDVHYHSAYMLKYSTHMRFTFVELLANFGGIIGLFLGASLLSGVEFVYYFSIGLYTHLRKERVYAFGMRHNKVNAVKFLYTKHNKISKPIRESKADTRKCAKY